MSTQVQQVKDASDIVSLIGERISLQRSGRNFRALCPFHSERSPSFFVSPEMQTFRCFGCNEGGDVFTFLERYEGMSFVEALSYLADQAGIVIEKFQSTQEDQTREKLLEILNLTKEYYHFLLTKHPLGEPGRAYIGERKISQETVKEFQLGYSINSWDGLIKYLVGKKKYNLVDLEKAGLVIARQGQSKKSVGDYYDRFRGRLMFPLLDHRGRVVGFSGRVLDSQTKTAKYINSPETQLYHKSKLLFGYSQHFRKMREANSVLVMEGEIDVLSSAQAHVRNVVAIKGSALTKEQIELLSRAVDTIILSLDADSAGIEATKRSIGLITQFSQVQLRVLPSTVLSGKDPDEIAREDPKKWREAVKHSVSAYQFLIDVAFAKYDAHTGEGKQSIMRDVSESIASIPHAVEKAHYVTVLAGLLGVSEQVVEQDLKGAKVFDRLINHEQVEEKIPPEQKTQEFLLSALLHLRESQVISQAKEIDTSLLTVAAIARTIEYIQNFEREFSLSSFRSMLPSELLDMTSRIYLTHQIEEGKEQSEFDQALKNAKTLAGQLKVQRLTRKLKDLEEKTEMSPEDEKNMDALLKEIVGLRKK